MTALSRRSLLGATAATAGGIALLPTLTASAHAEPHPAAGLQAPGFQRIRVGDAIVTALLDGYIDVLPEWWLNTSEEALTSALTSQFLNPTAPLRISVNAFVVEVGGRRIAIDAGADAFFGPSAGGWAKAFAAAGFAPEDIDIVLISHMHPDHIGGMITGGRAVFPNAGIKVNATDLAYWTSETEQASAPDFAKPWYDAARDVTRLYGDRLETFEGDAKLVDGISAVALPGHTPGHTGFLIESAGETLFLWSDVTDFLALQLNAPERTLVFDIDPVLGEASRRKAFELATTERLHVGGAHIPFPGFGRIQTDGADRRFLPTEWQHVI